MRFLRIDDSSNVQAIGYDPHTLALEVKFKGGGHYRYDQCSNAQFVELACAASVGKYLSAEFIKKTVAHPCTKIEDVASPVHDKMSEMKADSAFGPSRDEIFARELSTALDVIEKIPGIDAAIKTIRYVRDALRGE